MVFKIVDLGFSIDFYVGVVIRCREGVYVFRDFYEKVEKYRLNMGMYGKRNLVGKFIYLSNFLCKKINSVI